MLNNKKRKVNKITENKGVNIVSSDLDNDTSCKDDISVSNVRNDLQRVIDTMGPITPQHPNPNGCDLETDNEDSSYSFSSVAPMIPNGMTKLNETSMQEDSEMTVFNVSDLSESCYVQKKDAGVQTTNRFYPSVDFYPPHLFIDPKINNDLNKCNFLKEVTERKSRLSKWLGLAYKNQKQLSKDYDLYKINIQTPINDHSPPRRLVFDLMDELPQAEMKTIGTNTKCFKNQHNAGIHKHHIVNNGGDGKNVYEVEEENPTEKVDIYYFDHGNAGYYRTTDSAPVIMTEYLAERTEHYTKRFWAQFFGTVHIGVSFVMSFILQLFRFLLQAIIRPLTVGLIQLFSDYFIKPCLAVLFNGVVQPPMIFLYNFATSLRDVCEPIASSVGYFIREIAVLCKSIRLVQIETNKK